MKKIVLAALLGAACVPAAHATTFAFTDQFSLGLDLHTFTWTSGPLVTGTFDATLTGVTFTDITNFTVFVNGVQITTAGRFDSVILSSDGSNDDFYVSYDTNTYASHYGIGSYHDIETADIQGIGGDFHVAAVPIAGGVPEPASWTLMLGGFGMLGAALRHRRKLALSFG